VPAAPPHPPRPHVVHASRGRLRVHLPDPDGRTAARLRLLPGVRHAAANPWTDNLLILFDPGQTSEQALLAELVGLPAPPPLPPAPAPRADEPADGAGPGGYVTGVRRVVYQGLGWASVGMAFVGLATPGIPGAPFALLAGYFFIRSSPAAHRWLLRSRGLGQFLREWEQQGAVRRPVKYTALGMMAAGLGVSILIGLPPAALGTIVVLEAVGLVVILRLPVVAAAACFSRPSPSRGGGVGSGCGGLPL
jgi:uncharacterized membrane protein YbaN (DUF454 family)